MYIYNFFNNFFKFLCILWYTILYGTWYKKIKIDSRYDSHYNYDNNNLLSIIYCKNIIDVYIFNFFFLYENLDPLVIWEYWVMWTRNSLLPSMFTFHLFMSHLFQMTHTFSVFNSLYMYYSTSSLSIFLKEIKKINNSNIFFFNEKTLFICISKDWYC